MMPLFRCIAVLALLLCVAYTAQSQVELEYRYGEPSSSTAGSNSTSRNELIRQGINQAFGGQTRGIVEGAISNGLPDVSVSLRRIQEEQTRSQWLARRWESLKNTPPVDAKGYLENYNEKKRIESLLKYQTQRNPNVLRKWLSDNDGFKQRAATALYDLRSSLAQTQENQQLRAFGEEAVTQADKASSQRDDDAASFYYSVARACADILVGIDPITGTLRAIYESVTGRNFITGEQLSNFEHGLAIFSVVTLGYSGEIARGIELFRVLAVNNIKNTTLYTKAISYARFLVSCFSVFRAASKVEESSPRFIGMLAHASSGARQRAEVLRAAYESVETGATRNYPELYRLEDEFVMNLSLGEATRVEADQIGLAFVGENAIETTYRQDPTIKIFRSQDGRRVYRQAIFKSGLNKHQANLEIFAPKGYGRSSALSNAHIDIK